MSTARDIASLLGLERQLAFKANVFKIKIDPMRERKFRSLASGLDHKFFRAKN